MVDEVVTVVVVVDVVDPESQYSQVNWQCLATQFLLHFPLFFLLWHFLVGQISSQTSPVVVVVVVVVEEPVDERKLSQCGNSMIFLSLIFYMKSNLGVIEVQNLLISIFWGFEF